MTYRSPTTAMRHQREAIEACRRKPPAPCPSDVFGYLMDMGTGKTKVVLDEWGEEAVNGGLKDLLVVAPAGSYRNWFADKGADPEMWSEIRKHVDPELFDRTSILGWKTGMQKLVSGKDAIKTFIDSGTDTKRARVLVVNVEALSTVEALQLLCREFLLQRGARMVIDESTTIKSHKSERSKVCVELGQVARARRILSGLWAPQSPMDVFMQCQFLDKRILGQGNFFTFQRRYAVMQTVFYGAKRVQKIDGYQNLEELQRLVGAYTYRVKIDDCIDLPKKTYAAREVELTPDQKRMINEIRQFGNAQIAGTDKYVTTDMVIKMITRITQIACGYVMDDEERIMHEVKENRTDALIEVVGEHGGKVIIWVPWTVALKKIAARLTEEYGPAAVAQWFGGNRDTRHEDEWRFLNDPNCRFMVATQGAGMRGNTWTVADLTVYYANNYNLEERDQSEARNYRKGQTKPVLFVDLIAPGTNDEKVVQNLRRKIDLATMLNKEGHREWLV